MLQRFLTDSLFSIIKEGGLNPYPLPKYLRKNDLWILLYLLTLPGIEVANFGVAGSPNSPEIAIRMRDAATKIYYSIVVIIESPIREISSFTEHLTRLVRPKRATVNLSSMNGHITSELPSLPLVARDAVDDILDDLEMSAIRESSNDPSFAPTARSNDIEAMIDQLNAFLNDTNPPHQWRHNTLLSSSNPSNPRGSKFTKDG